MRIFLTDQSVAEVKCPPGKRGIKVSDTRLPGFGLRVTETGVRTFKYRHGHAGGSEMSLGRFGEITTAKARAQAIILRGQFVGGDNPVADRRAKAAASKATEAANAYTVDALIADWTANHLCDRPASYRLRVPRQMRVALAAWCRAPADKLQRTDAARVLDRVKRDRGPVAANRLHAEARACWGWAKKRGALAANPWADLPRPSRETARDRVLTDSELAVLWSAAGDLGSPWSGIVRLMLLTGQRRGEVAGMRWDEIDLAAAVWTLPAARTKNHQEHTVPLAAPALDLLRQVTQFHGQPLVFAGARQTVPSGFGKLKRRLDVALANAANEAGRAAVPWVLHDIRRTVATGLQKLGGRLEVTESLLNHVSGSVSGIVKVYQRHKWVEEKEAAARAWAAHLVPGAPLAGNVVRLAAAG